MIGAQPIPPSPVSPVPLEPAPLQHTLPALLDAACERDNNATAFNEWTGTGWQAVSNHRFRASVESLALGFLNLNLVAGDRVVLLMHSNLDFALVDLGCLLAHLVNVPIDLTQTLENIVYILNHSGAKALIVSDLDLLQQLSPYLTDLPQLQHIIIADLPKDCALPCPSDVSAPVDSHPLPTCAGLELHHCLAQTDPTGRISLPTGVKLHALGDLQSQASPSTTKLQQLRTTLSLDDLATLIYIPNDHGQLLGVMLSHHNLAENALAAFSELPELGWGATEVALFFLPFNHVFARCMLYGHIYYGHSIYFSQPQWVLKHLAEIKPTILATVPLFLEKVYSQILKRGKKLPAWQRLPFMASLYLARQYQLGKPPSGLYATLLKLADWLVLCHWRTPLGGRLNYLLCGGAALNAEIANVFTAAGIPVLQGYGLTQAGGTVSFNRGRYNRAGSVGLPMTDVEVTLAPDREILVRSPYLMSGYYQNPKATQTDLDSQGWLHTGDLGQFTPEGVLEITGLKKPLFKLSTGKYIAPLPIQQRLQQSTFVMDAVVVGAGQKFTAVLIFPNFDALQHLATELKLNLSGQNLLQHDCILGLYRTLVESVNCHLPYWAIVKRFRLISTPLTQTIDRAQVLQQFATEIAGLYQEGSRNSPHLQAEIAPPEPSEFDAAITGVACPTYPVTPCPVFAQSLDLRQKG